MRVTQKMAAAFKGTRMRELRALGFTSDVFPAQYRGRCASSGMNYPVGEPICFFTGFDRPILATIANELVRKAKDAAAPKCGCGKPGEVNFGRGPDSATCGRCDMVAEYYFEIFAADVSRDSSPIY